MRYRLLVLVALAASSTVHAHEPRQGPNGGTLVDAGDHHVELVTMNTSVQVYLSDATDAPVSSEGFKGTAILLVDGRPERVTLEPSGGSVLSGEAAASVLGAVKGAVQLTGPDGTSAQAKFD